jgi:hypothetical protein
LLQQQTLEKNMTTNKKEREKKKRAQRFMIEQIASRVRIQQYQNYLKDKTKSPSFLGDQNVIPLLEQSSNLDSFSPSLPPSLLLQQQQQQTIDNDLPAFNPSLPSSTSQQQQQQQTVDDKANLNLPFKSCLSYTLMKNQPPAPRYLTTLNQPLLDIPVPSYIKREDFKIVSPFKMSVRPTADFRLISPSKITTELHIYEYDENTTFDDEIPFTFTVCEVKQFLASIGVFL